MPPSAKTSPACANSARCGRCTKTAWTSAASSGYASKGTPSPKSTYETPEERAARQRLIVRQSCLSNAVETLKVDKKGVDPTEALKLAERYVGWVFGEEAKVDVPDVGFDYMEDDVPL